MSASRAGGSASGSNERERPPERRVRGTRPASARILWGPVGGQEEGKGIREAPKRGPGSTNRQRGGVGRFPHLHDQTTLHGGTPDAFMGGGESKRFWSVTVTGAAGHLSITTHRIE